MRQALLRTKRSYRAADTVMSVDAFACTTWLRQAWQKQPSNVKSYIAHLPVHTAGRTTCSAEDNAIRSSGVAYHVDAKLGGASIII